jgi:hypothetical protein
VFVKQGISKLPQMFSEATVVFLFLFNEKVAYEEGWPLFRGAFSSIVLSQLI